jgi:hypothetical protein
MADSQQNPQPAPSKHRQVLEDRFDKKVADAIVGVAREEALAVFNEQKEEIRQLIADQVAVRRQADELPADDRAAVAPQVNDANHKVRAVVEDANDIDARQQAGEKVDPQEIQDLDERANQARESSDQARQAVDRKAVAAARASREHEAQQASRSKQPADTATGDYSLAGLGARVDQLEACQGDLKVVSATAFASATSGDDSGSRRRVVAAAGLAALVTFVIYLFILLGSAKWDWSWAIGLPAVVAAIVGLVVWALTSEPGPSAESVAHADAIVARWSGRDDGSHQDDEGRDHVVPGMRQQSDHGAHAHAGASARS